jgi:16S rRNA (cytosine967-C5)-methyltransferase
VRFIHRHIHDIIGSYDGSLPLSHFLKAHFRQHPILGSRDRKLISAVVYTWYRCAKGIAGSAWIDPLTDTFIATRQYNEIPLHDQLAAQGIPFDEDALLAASPALSEGITRQQWLRSMLVQPSLFIRIRKNKTQCLNLLLQRGISYEAVDDQSIALPNGSRIEDVLPADAYVVQDASSRRTGDYFRPQKNEEWYDCCSGAGGKSLLLKDMEPTVRLTVSDRRESILHNLRERFKLYGLSINAAFVTDVSDQAALAATMAGRTFHNIICDAPCSGSGTWARTPEQLYFFDAGRIQEYASLQKSIACNVATLLKPGGRLIYITCSVFREENEEVVSAIQQHTSLQLLESHLLNGISAKADSMFIAILKK